MSHLDLVADGLTVSWGGGTPVLSAVSVSVTGGSRTAVLGANGSGKTTLLRALSGALRPDGGSLRVGGVATEYSRAGLRAHRQQVQLVLQDPDDQLFSADVVRDVAYGPRNLGLTDAEVTERVDEALSMMGIEHLRRRPTHQLSYGERKRVATAGALAMRPCVLLLDEPTAGLDPVGVDEMFGALDRLEKSHTTVVLSTHDVALALEWATSVALVVGGAVHQGDPVTVLSDSAVLARARLRVPWSLEVASRLALEGLAHADARPRNAAEVVAAVRDRPS